MVALLTGNFSRILVDFCVDISIDFSVPVSVDCLPVGLSTCWYDFTGPLHGTCLRRLPHSGLFSIGFDSVEVVISPFLKTRCSVDVFFIVSIVDFHCGSVAV